MPVGRYVLDLHGESHACYPPSDALCISLQILNHMQDCAQGSGELDRCYLPQALLDHFGASVDDLRLPAETPALRRVFITLLDRIDRMNHAAAELPEHRAQPPAAAGDRRHPRPRPAACARGWRTAIRWPPGSS